MNKIVAIHQPNFFPWLGYFDKIVRADIFIFFDDTQFPKTGGTWCNRVKLLVASESRWITAAVDRGFSGTRSIREMRFSAGTPWRNKILKSLQTNYRRHPCFAETMTVIEPLLLNPEPNVAEYNIAAVTRIAQALGLDTTKLRRASDFPAKGHATERLCSLTSLSGGSIYLCGGGADGYQIDSMFARHGLKLLYQSFRHPVYPQQSQNVFIPGLSVLDAAMNLGWDGTGALLKARRC